jgi:CBS domain-containing protein
MNSVRRVLGTKRQGIWTVAPDASVFNALRVMAEQDIGAVMVVEEGHLIGIFTERDYARKIALQGKISQDTRVRDVMTSNVIYVRPEQTVEECMAIMSNRHVRHLPVVEDDRLVGMVSMRDVVRQIIAEQEFIIEQLVNYITDRRVVAR